MKPLDICSLAELETLFATTPLGPEPRGCFRGRVLRYVDSPGARRPLVRALDWLLFEAPPFGVDFDRGVWWFVRPPLAAGRFALSRERSRWRDTDTLALRYSRSRLPRPIRDLLYDEIKPIDDQQCLGIGGINAERGAGDHFFFELRRS
jgi:hypothetical protein